MVNYLNDSYHPQLSKTTQIHVRIHGHHRQRDFEFHSARFTSRSWLDFISNAIIVDIQRFSITATLMAKAWRVFRENESDFVVKTFR